MRYAALVTSAAFFPIALGGMPASAQELPRPVLPAGAEQRAPQPMAERLVGSTIGAAAVGAIGMLAAGYLGFYLTGGSDICGDDACGFFGRVLGGVLGEAVGIGLGAHLGNGRRGDPLAPVGASLAVLVGAIALSDVVRPSDAWLVVVPVLQISTAVFAELTTHRRVGPSP